MIRELIKMILALGIIIFTALCAAAADGAIALVVLALGIVFTIPILGWVEDRE